MKIEYYQEKEPDLSVAVIGLSGRFPQARDLAEFWQNLKIGKDCITFFTNKELLKARIDPFELQDPNYIKAKGIIGDIEYFDANFFGYLPREAEIMDPQIRLFHECAYESLENAGYDPERYQGLIGIYAGARNNNIWVNKVIQPSQFYKIAPFGLRHLIDKDCLAARVAYQLNLRGPALILDTACSTSLVAVHLACLALLTGECDLALAGGVSIKLPEASGYLYQKGGIYSADGQNRTFDIKASGTVFSDGVGVVVLKRLKEAIDDKDNILAVIKGTAINNDGRAKAGYTAPSIDGQAKVIKNALQIAGIEPETLTYIEAHGTATDLGDAVEIEALKEAFSTDKKQYCAIGSVKSNIGHTDITAGVAGFIKTVLALQNELIPATLHFKRPNPKINFEDSPFYVAKESIKWKKKSGLPRRAGISSFGIGGTNAHVILEEAPELSPSDVGRPNQLISLSAKTPTALEIMTKNLIQHLKDNPKINLADVAWTLQVGRGNFSYRRMMECSNDVKEAIKNLSILNPEKVQSNKTGDITKEIIFMFPGTGSQYVNMGRQIYEEKESFRNELNYLFSLIKNKTGQNVIDILYPSRNSEAEHLITETQLTQPIIFCFEYALAKLLMKWGIRPNRLIGHSLGEYTAASLAGVISPEDTIGLLIKRGQLMSSLIKPGSMLVVSIAEKELGPILNEFNKKYSNKNNYISIAAINSPGLITIAGPNSAVDQFNKELLELGYKTKKLTTNHAFHSNLLRPILGQFKSLLKEIDLKKPDIPYVSCLTGKLITSQEATSPEYWAKQLSQTVQFEKGIKELLKEDQAIFIEVGPGTDLTTCVNQNKSKQSNQLVINLIKNKLAKTDSQNDINYLLFRVGQLWLEGVQIDWQAFHQGEKRRRIPLPTYPFEGKRYWPQELTALPTQSLQLPAQTLTKKSDLADWFYVPVWEPKPLSTNNNKIKPDNWLIFSNNPQLNNQLAQHLRQAGQSVVFVQSGKKFRKVNHQLYIINNQHSTDYDKLINQLKPLPTRIIHTWSLEPGSLDQTQDKGLYSLIYLAQALGKHSLPEELVITALTQNLHPVTKADQPKRPEQATILGPVKVIPQEYPGIRCQSIDIDQVNSVTVKYLIDETQTPTTDIMIAYRDNQRYVQTFKATKLAEPKTAIPAKLRPQGTYLITGGLGAIGSTLAEYLAKTVKANLILISRTKLPERRDWDKWLKQNNSISAKIATIKQLEKLGSKVLTISADVANYQQMSQAINQAIRHFGKINGIIHAAGNVDNLGIIQNRTKDKTEKNISSKLQGTLILSQLCPQPDFFILCSSLASILAAPAGEVGYVAANSFLDLFAQSQARHNPQTLTASINWAAWQGIGMAAEAEKRKKRKDLISLDNFQSTKLTNHHLFFDQRLTNNTNLDIFISHFSPKKNWFLAEHRILGRPTLPGFMCLELARAAYFDKYNQKFNNNLTINFKEIQFEQLLVIEDTKEVRTILIKSGQDNTDNFEFIIASRPDPKEDLWQEHARGSFNIASHQELNKNSDFENLIFAKEKKQRINSGKNNSFSQFGPRWSSIEERVKLENNQIFATIELPDKFKNDIKSYKLHPAILDRSISLLASKMLGAKVDKFLPFSIKNLTVNKELPAVVKSNVQYATNFDNDSIYSEAPAFKVVITNSNNEELIKINEFILRKVRRDTVNRASLIKLEPFDKIITPSFFDSINQKKQLTQVAITPAQGAQIFSRLINSEFGQSQLVISNYDLPRAVEQSNLLISHQPSTTDIAQPITPTPPTAPRPNLVTAYAPPDSQIEQTIAQIWQNHFGYSQIGGHDNIFDLGGSSLDIIAINSKLTEQFKITIPLVAIFQNPTIKKLAAFLENQLKKKKSEKALVIKKAGKKKYYLASKVQKEFWRIAKRPDPTFLNIPYIIKFMGFLNVKILQKTLQEVIKRHEILRTNFLEINGELFQVIKKKAQPTIKVVNLSKQKVGQHQLWRLIRNEIYKPFDLGKDLLIRIKLIKTGQRGGILILVIHNMVWDGLSCQLLIDEWAELYNSYLEKRSSHLSSLSLQFKDYANWEQSDRRSGEKERQKSYWLKKLKGDLPLPLRFPPDKISLSRRSTPISNRETLIIDNKEILGKIKKICHQTKATTFMFVLALLDTFLFKVTGERDLIVGTNITLRNLPESSKLIGPLFNNLALRNELLPKQNFIDVLRAAKKTTLEAFANREYTFSEFLENKRISKNTDCPLLNVFLDLFPLGRLMRKFKGIEFTFTPPSFGKTSFDLKLSIRESLDRLLLVFTYNPNLFSRKKMKQSLQNFKEILRQVVRNPYAKISDLKMVKK